MTHAHADFGNGATGEPGAFPEQAQTTGRQVVVLSDAVHGDEAAMMEALRSTAGITNVARSTEFAAGALELQQAEGAEAALFTDLGVAVVPGDPDRVGALTAAAAEDERIEAVEPEKILYATTEPAAMPLDYLRGFRDAANELYEHANHGNGGVATEVAAVAQFVDT